MIIVRQFKGQLVGILGLGKTGINTIKSLLAGGARIIAWDDNPSSMRDIEALELIEKDNLRFAYPTEDDWNGMSVLVASPGVPLYYPKLHSAFVNAKKYNIPIISDIELLQLAQPLSCYIGITGTNGKSTTTALIAHIFREVGKQAQECGNIGKAVLDTVPFDSKSSYYVIEMSSFQLDLSYKTHFDIAICLNITPDHLDRHGTFERYVEAKSMIFQNQCANDFSIVSTNTDGNEDLLKYLENHKYGGRFIKISSKLVLPVGVSVVNDILYDNYFTNKHYKLTDISGLRGEHNAENIAAAFTAASAAKIDAKRIIDALGSFKALKHRMELIYSSGKLNFINDSKATNVDSAYWALKTFDNIYWIAGGRSKTKDMNRLQPLLKNIKHAYLIGEAAEEIASFLSKNGISYSVVHTLDKALSLIKEQKIDIGNVLFSPACSSFDQWKNFEERGDAFAELVRKNWYA